MFGSGKYRVLLLVWLASILASCASMDTERGVGFTNDIALVMHGGDVVSGQTTAADLEAWFGKPWLRERTPAGQERWLYLFEPNGGVKLDLTLVGDVVVDHRLRIPSPE